MTASRRLPSLLALAATLIVSALGCAHRVTLDRSRFDGKIALSDENASRIRVYVDHRFKVTYKVPRRGGAIIDSDIHLTGRRQLLHHIVGRNTRGKLIAIEARGDRPLLYISFDDRCSAKRCAFAFVASADNTHFSLAEVPDLVPAVTTLSARDRGLGRRLKLGYLRHLSEPAPVYRAARRRRGPLTVDLEVVEHRKPKRVRFRFDDGVRKERPDEPPRQLTRRPSPKE